MSFELSAIIVSWVAIALLALALAGVVRQLHALTSGARLAGSLGPPVGAAFAESAGDAGDVAELLVFLEPDCGVCSDLLPVIESVRRSNAGALRVKAVVRGEAFTEARDRGLEVMTNQDELFAAMSIPMTPFAVLLGPDRRVVASGMVGSQSALLTFVQGVAERRIAA